MSRILFVSCLLGLGGLAGWFAHGWAVADSSKGNAGLHSCRVAKGRMEQTVKARGIVKASPNAMVRVGFPFPKDQARRISRLVVQEGDLVGPGGELAELDHADLDASRQQLLAEQTVLERRLFALRMLEPVEVRVAETLTAQAKAQLDQAKQIQDRLSRLGPTSATTIQERETATNDVALATAKVEQTEAAIQQIHTKYRADMSVLEAQVQQSEAAIQSIEVQVKWSRLLSPLKTPAQVFAVHQRQGELTSGQPGAPVLTLLDLEQLAVHLFIDETDFGRIQLEQPVTLRLESYHDRVISGRIVRLLPQPILQENVVYYLAIVEVAKEQRGMLKMEMTALAQVQGGVRESVLWLPLAAVKSRPGGWYVLRSGSPGPVETPVQIGWKDQGRVEIRAGLAEGDEVLLDP